MNFFARHLRHMHPDTVYNTSPFSYWHNTVFSPFFLPAELWFCSGQQWWRLILIMLIISIAPSISGEVGFWQVWLMTCMWNLARASEKMKEDSKANRSLHLSSFPSWAWVQGWSCQQTLSDNEKRLKNHRLLVLILMSYWANISNRLPPDFLLNK